MIGLQAQANLLFVETDPGFTFSGDPNCAIYYPKGRLAITHAKASKGIYILAYIKIFS